MIIRVLESRSIGIQKNSYAICFTDWSSDKKSYEITILNSSGLKKDMASEFLKNSGRIRNQVRLSISLFLISKVNE